MSSGCKFLLVGNGPYANRGCEAIVRGTTAILSRVFPQASFIVSSVGESARQDLLNENDSLIEHRPHEGNPKRFSSVWWKLRLKYPTDKAMRGYRVELGALSESSCVLQVGGDNYSLDYGVPTWMLNLDQAIIHRKKPVVIWGASVGPFSKEPEVERLMSDHLRKINLILVRESESLSYLSSIGVQENVRLVADPAFVLPVIEPELSDELMRFVDRRPIGVNLSPLVGGWVDGGLERWKAIVKDCIQAVVDSGLGPVLLVPHVVGIADNDFDFLRAVAESVSDDREKLGILPPTLSASGYKWVISKMRVFAGARTHSTIASLSTKVPTLSIGYSIKSRGLNKDVFGNLDYLVPVQDLTPSLLVEKLRSILNEEDKVRTHLDAAIPVMQDRAYGAAGHLAHLLDCKGGVKQ